jgi:hypothetical protein
MANFSSEIAFRNQKEGVHFSGALKKQTKKTLSIQFPMSSNNILYE